MDWPISEVARMPGVTARTLRHYDETGLLPPARIGANGYRYYEEHQLLLLQQILVLRASGCRRSAGSLPRRSTRWLPCGTTTGGCSRNGTGSMPWPTPSPARSPNWSSPGRGLAAYQRDAIEAYATTRLN